MTKDEALKLALEALELSAITVDSFGVQRKTYQAIMAVKEALAQQALDRKAENARELDLDYEPVGWPCLIAEADFSQNTVTLAMQCEDYKVSAGQHWLSTIPPQRPWVGLTDKEKKEIEKQSVFVEGAVRLTEAKLKEKNNG
jgi:hypothetical protein